MQVGHKGSEKEIRTHRTTEEGGTKVKMKLTSRDLRMNEVQEISLEQRKDLLYHIKYHLFSGGHSLGESESRRYPNSLMDCLCDGNANLSGKSFVSISGNLLVGKIITFRQALASGSGLFQGDT